MEKDIIPRQDKVKRAMTVGPLRSRLSDEGSYMRNVMWGRLSPTNLSSSQRRNTASGSNYGVRSDSMRSQRSTYSEPDGSNHRKTSDLWSSSPGNRRSQSDSATPVTSEKFPGNDLGKNTILTKDGGLSVVGGFVRGWNRLSDRGFRRKVSIGESTHSSSLQSSRNVSQASTPHSSPATSPRLQHSSKTNITLDEKPRKERDLFQRLHSSKRKDSASAAEEITVEYVEVKNEQPVFLCDVLDAPSFIMPKTSTGHGTHTSYKDIGSTEIRDKASNEGKEESENLRPCFSGNEHIFSASSSENLLKGWPIWDKIPGEALPEQETSL